MVQSPRALNTLYAPEQLGREDLLARWVGRGPLLRALVERLARGAGEGPPHRLVVGAPGTGRTALLARLKAAVTGSPDLAARWRVLSLPPRPWGVCRVADLWLAALELLAQDEPAAQARLDAVRALEAEHTLEAAALEALVEAAGRNVLLLVDGLDGLAEQGLDLGALGARLREEPRLTLVATCAAAPRERRQSGLWKTEPLEPLSADEGLELLAKLASASRAEPVQALLSHQPERAQALVELLGGRPADLVRLYAVWSLSTEGDAATDLRRWLDLGTPERTAQLQHMAPQARQILAAVAGRLDPCSAGQVAEAARLDVRLVSAQINRLVQHGALDKARLRGSSRLGFVVRDRALGWGLLHRRGTLERLEGLAELRALLRWRRADPLSAFTAGLESAPGSAPARQKALAALRQGLPTARRSWPAPWSVESFSGVLVSAPLHLGARARLAEALPGLPDAAVAELGLGLAMEVGQLGLLFGEGFNRALTQACLSGEMSGPSDIGGAETAARRLRADGLPRFAALWAALESPSLEALNAAGSRLGARLSPGEALLWAAAASRARQRTLLVSASAMAWAGGATEPSFPVAWLLLAGSHALPAPGAVEPKTARSHPGLLAAYGLSLGDRPEAIEPLREALAALRDPEEVAGRLPEGLASYYFDALEDGSLGRALLRQLRTAPRRALARQLLGQPGAVDEVRSVLAEEEHPTQTLLAVLLDALRAGRPEAVLAFLSDANLSERWAPLRHAAQSRVERTRDGLEGLAPETRAVSEALLAALGA